ncbi:hypothetical protein ACFW04_010781 [Cataglyphis niger]
MVDRGLTLAVLPPSPRQGTAITYATRSTPRRRHRLARSPTYLVEERERDAHNAYVVYFEAQAIRAGVIFSSAMHGRRYSRREHTVDRLGGARGKKIWHTGQSRFSTLVSSHPPFHFSLKQMVSCLLFLNIIIQNSIIYKIIKL